MIMTIMVIIRETERKKQRWKYFRKYMKEQIIMKKNKFVKEKKGRQIEKEQKVRQDFERKMGGGGQLNTREK